MGNGSSASKQNGTLKETLGDHEESINCMALSEDGSMLARTRVDSSRVTGPPLVVGEVLYAQSDGGSLVAFGVVRRSARR